MTRLTIQETAMNIRTRIALLSALASFGIAPIHATEASVREPGFVIDCANPVLPSQREVGEMTGQSNFGQVYATRARLMSQARRACQREGATRVRLVMAVPVQESARSVAQAKTPR